MQTTRERVAAGQAFVALTATGELVGTITIAPPKRPDGRYLGDPVPKCCTQSDTAILAQLAVHPSCRGQGVAERLMDIAEAWAQAQGYAHVALDTAVPAQALRRRYERRGYAYVGDVQWAGKTYPSVLMRKEAGAPDRTRRNRMKDEDRMNVVPRPRPRLRPRAARRVVLGLVIALGLTAAGAHAQDATVGEAPQPRRCDWPPTSARPSSACRCRWRTTSAAPSRRT